jgi:hypothetical protein
MSATGNAMGTAIVVYRTRAREAFLAARKPGPYSLVEVKQLALLQSKAEGIAIVDNLPPSQGGGASNWDGGQANTQYGGTVAIDGGNA